MCLNKFIIKKVEKNNIDITGSFVANSAIFALEKDEILFFWEQTDTSTVKYYLYLKLTSTRTKSFKFY